MVRENEHSSSPAMEAAFILIMLIHNTAEISAIKEEKVGNMS